MSEIEPILRSGSATRFRTEGGGATTQPAMEGEPPKPKRMLTAEQKAKRTAAMQMRKLQKEAESFVPGVEEEEAEAEKEPSKVKRVLTEEQKAKRRESLLKNRQAKAALFNQQLDAAVLKLDAQMQADEATTKMKPVKRKLVVSDDEETSHKKTRAEKEDSDNSALLAEWTSHSASKIAEGLKGVGSHPEVVAGKTCRLKFYDEKTNKLLYVSITALVTWKEPE